MKIKTELKIDLKNEQLLLLKTLQLRIDSSKIIEVKKVVENSINWDYWLELVKVHGVAPLVYQICQQHLSNLIPEKVLNSLDFFYRQNIARNLSLSNELVKIFKLLKEHNINILPYKGPVLSEYLYQNLALRCSTDIDLIVLESDLYQVKNILVSANYKFISVAKNIDKLNPPLQWQSEYLMATPNYKILIDIHKKLTREDFFYPLPMTYIWENLTEITFLNQKLSYFDPNKLFFILATHGTKHCWESMIWLYDLVSLINHKKDLDLNEVLKIADQTSQSRMILLTLYLCQQLFLIKIPKNIEQRIQADPNIHSLFSQSINRLFNPKISGTKVTFEDNFLEKVKFYLQLQDSFQGKLKQILSFIKFLISPNLRDWNFYPLAVNFYFLYYLIRPFRLTSKLIFKS